ncbi:peptide chain release factor 1 [Candidatus Dependentiae bacterium]|nr:peptide chain release factor 1 [Candidatus Dependentiae bacterium]
MALNWDTIQSRHDEIGVKLADPQLDSKQRLILQKELARLTPVLQKHNDIVALERRIADSKQQVEEAQDSEMVQLFQEDIQELNEQLEAEQKFLDDLMYPPDEHDDRSVFLEIRAGAGGQEASLFAGDLLKMYTMYAEQSKNWKASIESASQTDLGGFKEVVLYIKGKNVYGHLKNESGVHRVQRVPATESSGRVHTSTATVAVLPEAKEVDMKINPADLRIDVFRASGAGGQHVNTTDSAVRITHVPTGVVVSCQDERSQHKNKAKAMKQLQSRLLLAQIEKQEAEMRKKRKAQVGTGMRAEKVRTYNYPQNRVTDHQVNMTLNKLDMVMTGSALDEIIQVLRDKDREERKQQSFLVTS